MRPTFLKRPRIGVLAGWQVYETMIPVSFLGPVLNGIRAAARDHDCHLMIACGMGPARTPSDTRPAWPEPSPDVDFVPVGPWNTDGLIVINPLRSEARSCYIQNLIAAGHPVAFVGTSEGGPAVGIDNESGVHQAIAHLAAHSHQRIAFIAGHPQDAHGDSGERLRAYREAVAEYGLAQDESLIACGLHTLEGGRQAMRQMLDAGVSFTAALASNDESAIGAMQALREAGRRIPQDVAVIGFDDWTEASVQSPPLTTVHTPVSERGYRALELLLEHMEKKGRDAEIIRLPVHLIVRQSCGCAPGHIVPAAGAVAQSGREAPAQGSLSQAISEIVLSETLRLSPGEVYDMCDHLAGAFVLSLERNEAAAFDHAIEDILRRVEATSDDPHVWQAALSVLRERSGDILQGQPPAAYRQALVLAEEMLDRARVAISESVRRQHRQYLVAQSRQADLAGPLTSRLLAALDEKQIFAALADHLPLLGIHRAGVAFYEAEGNDPQAHSILYAAPNEIGTPLRFPSRQFPPPELYPPDRRFDLALLPLVIQGRQEGYVVFDADNLDLLGSITRQLAAAINAARLYREAVEGRRLAEEGRRLAEEANRLKSQFLSTVSHELRTPLSLIVGLSELLQREARGESSPLSSYQQDLERIQASAQHLDGLIQDVLDLARSEVGQLRLIREPLDLAEVLQTAAIVGEHLARAKGLAWRAEIPGGLPKIWGDRTRLRQVALNLISNAVKFTTHGEIALKVERENGTIAVKVSDTGMGVLQEEQNLIFEEFRRSDRATARGYGGIGLGLAICKRLIELHGGEIGVFSSGEGAGATFYFTLPIMTPQPAPAGAEPQCERAVWLLAEQGESMGPLRNRLSQHGFRVHTQATENVTDWLSALMTAQPEAVILDSKAASEQGWNVLNALKKSPATQDTAVLFYAPGQEKGLGSVLELDYLTKPIGTEALARALERQGLTGGAGEEKTILIADDEPYVLEMHTRLVQERSANWRVLKARDGREALELIRQKHPDLVLLDLMMPEIDGFGVLEAMRSDQATRDIPVIVLTGQTLTEKDMERLNRGVATVLSKGVFSAEETLDHVEAALARVRRLGNETQRLVRQAMAYIHEHYAEPLSREEIAYHIGVSSDYLTRCFTQETGVALTTYLRRYRIHQARKLLEAGETSIAQVAQSVGFQDVNYFSRVFKQEVGMPPGAYKRSR